VLRNYKRRARQHGLAWSLTSEEFFVLTARPCEYCDSPPQQVHQAHYSSEHRYNGLDRIDNGRGYLVDNVVPCCFVCNQMKGTMAQDAFLEQSRRIAARHPDS
jgi:hypothetical protein